MYQIHCRLCQKRFAIPCTKAQLDAWQGGRLIQKAMPSLSPAQRELLISSTCNECWERLFPEDKDL